MRRGSNSFLIGVFALMALLIGVAYYYGLTQDFGAVSTGVNQTITNITGRNSQGNFANYPTVS